MTNNFLKTIEDKQKDFTKSEMEIYNLLKTEAYSFTSSTATEIANKYNVSQSSISRFCQKIGFNGYSDFRLSLILALSTADAEHKQSISDYTTELSSLMTHVSQNVPEEVFDTLAKRIVKAHKTFLSGYGASGAAADLLAFRGVTIGLDMTSILPSREVETMHIIDNDDVVIIFSASNPSHRDFFSMLEDIPENKRPYIVLVSSSKNHIFAKKCYEVINIPYASYNYSSPNQVLQIFFALFLSNKLNYYKAKND